MLFAAPSVNVIPDAFTWFNLVFGFFGLAGAVVAIVIALRSQTKAQIAITEERHRVFELEVLRDLTKDLDETAIVVETMKHPSWLAKYRNRLNQMSTQLSLWEHYMKQVDQNALMEALGFGRTFQAAKDASLSANRERADTVRKLLAVEQDLIFGPKVGDDYTEEELTEWIRSRFGDDDLAAQGYPGLAAHRDELAVRVDELLAIENSENDQANQIYVAARAVTG
jgi:hypothetical protein